MGSDYGSGNMSLQLREGREWRESSQQSIIKALNSFVRAVNVMDQTVMIPSRLRDMDVSVNINGAKIPVENNNELAILPAIGTKQADLYSFYTMLHAIKNELVSGGPMETSEEGAQEDGTDAAKGREESDSRPTAAAFRYHLTSLLGMLRQMTTTANYLTSRYETELGQNAPQYSSWAV